MMEGLGAPRLESLGTSSVEGLGLARVEALAPKMRAWSEQPYYYPYYKDPAQGISSFVDNKVQNMEREKTFL